MASTGPSSTTNTTASSTGGSARAAEPAKPKSTPKRKSRAKKPSASSSSKKGASITLRGRFHPGSTVELVKVAGAHVLRPSASDEVVATEKVDKDGCVSFTKGVSEGDRYFIRGYHEGFPLNVRVRGRAAGDDSGELDQAPVGYDRVYTRDGREFGERGQRLAHPSGSDEPVR